MYIRLVLGLLAAVLLVGTHWKVYVLGGVAARAECQAKAFKDSEEHRARELALATQVERLDSELQKQKARDAAVARANAKRLLEYEAALKRPTPENPAATRGADGPFAEIAGECGRALVALDAHARQLETVAQGLQGYAKDVCVNR